MPTDTHENYESINFDRTDLTTGVFSEYSYTSLDNKLVLVVGARGDYLNSHGFEFLPRLNIRYNPGEQTVVRLSAGKAMRIANPIAENTAYFASSRTFEIQDSLGVELAWNIGANITHCFKLFDREATFNVDAYRTQFENQVVVDIEDPSKLRFYNLEGESYSNSIQFDINYELFERFDIKLAYKINQVYSTFDGKKQLSPLVPENRALANFAYRTDHKNQWLFDYTWNYIGKSRIPYHPLIESGNTFSDPFFVMNSQVTKRLKTLDIYLGVENLLNYKQDNPILGSNDPFGSNFDAHHLGTSHGTTYIYWNTIKNKLMKLGIIVYSTDAEVVFNAIRLANFSLKEKDDVRLFLLASGVEYENLHSIQFPIIDLAQSFLDDGGRIMACGTCLKLRQKDGTEMCPLSSMKDLYELVRDCDKILTF